MAAHALNLGRKATSPWREMGAYEALWSEENADFRSIARRFKAHPGYRPSDFFELDNYGAPAEYADRTHALLARGGVRRYGIRLHGAGEYPKKLREAESPVELLYYQGYWDLVDTPCVAIVGTRTPSPEGVKRAQKLARLLGDDGYTIVSGLAAGIDTAAHRVAIETGRPTIAVIGTPLSSVYPRENIDLQKVIARDHLLISQVPVCRYETQHWKVNRLFFKERNITMSALTLATIIVEAGNTSGTLIQARHAIKQKRDLFILDNCFKKPELTWPAYYEKRGAIRVVDIDDVKARLAERREVWKKERLG